MTFWESNVSALSKTNFLSDSVLQTLKTRGPWQGSWVRSRQDAPVPSVSRDGKQIPIVSLYDSGKEAERWAQTVSCDASVVIWGLCGPWAVQALIQQGAKLVFVVEPRLDLWSQALTAWDWTAFDLKGRVRAVVGTQADFYALFVQTYHPLWHRSVQTHIWRASYEPEVFENYERTFQDAISSLSADLSTQGRMANLWYRNTLRNLKLSRPAHFSRVEPEVAIVVGAGPSLETALESEEARSLLSGERRSKVIVLSTDTALPVLASHSITADLVLCLDGQSVSYQHFVEGVPEGTAFFADVSALPSLPRHNRPVFFSLSNHPFSQIVRRFYPDFPTIDTSLGNVAGMGIRLAEFLGAQKTILWGQDFSYPLAKTYARGTYVYPYFYRRSSRLKPSDHLLTAFALRTPTLSRTAMEGGIRYSNLTLDAYRKRLEDQAPSISTTLEQRSGYGNPIHGSGIPRPGAELKQNPTPERWREFSREWKSILERLPLPQDSDDVVQFTSRLEPTERTAWLSLWPLAVWIYRKQASKELTVSARVLLNEARRHALRCLESLLDET